VRAHGARFGLGEEAMVKRDGEAELEEEDTSRTPGGASRGRGCPPDGGTPRGPPRARPPGDDGGGSRLRLRSRFPPAPPPPPPPLPTPLPHTPPFPPPPPDDDHRPTTTAWRRRRRRRPAGLGRTPHDEGVSPTSSLSPTLCSGSPPLSTTSPTVAATSLATSAIGAGRWRPLHAFGEGMERHMEPPIGGPLPPPRFFAGERPLPPPTSTLPSPTSTLPSTTSTLPSITSTLPSTDSTLPSSTFYCWRAQGARVGPGQPVSP